MMFEEQEYPPNKSVHFVGKESYQEPANLSIAQEELKTAIQFVQELVEQELMPLENGLEGFKPEKTDFSIEIEDDPEDPSLFISVHLESSLGYAYEYALDRSLRRTNDIFTVEIAQSSPDALKIYQFGSLVVKKMRETWPKILSRLQQLPNDIPLHWETDGSQSKNGSIEWYGQSLRYYIQLRPQHGHYRCPFCQAEIEDAPAHELVPLGDERLVCCSFCLTNRFHPRTVLFVDSMLGKVAQGFGILRIISEEIESQIKIVQLAGNMEGKRIIDELFQYVQSEGGHGFQRTQLGDLSFGDVRVYLILKGGQVCGYCAWDSWFPETAKLNQLYTLPQFRRQYLAQHLVTITLQEEKREGLEIWIESPTRATLKLLEKLGLSKEEDGSWIGVDCKFFGPPQA